MQVLFVHGMGRSALSGWPMLFHLRKAGLHTASFAYSVSLQSFDHIEKRLTQHIIAVAAQGDYVLIGHSLGGVLIRSALRALPTETRNPKHIFLLGSPIQAALLAQKFQAIPMFRLLFRWVTRDCGNLLGSSQRMSAICIPNLPITAIVGIKGFSGQWSPFGLEANDGVVSLAEVSSVLISDQIKLPVVHSLLPANKQVTEIILQRIKDNHYISDIA